MQGRGIVLNPLRSRHVLQLLGSVLGPIIHRIARTYPPELPNTITSSFSGLAGIRKPPDSFSVIDISGMDPEDQMRIRVIQGLMNRDRPALYVISNDHDRFWLKQIPGEQSRVKEADLPTFPSIRFRLHSLIQRYLTLTLCGINDAIPTTTKDDDDADIIIDLSSLSDQEIVQRMIEVSNETSRSVISFRNSVDPEHVDITVRNKIFLSPLPLSNTIPIIGRLFPKRSKVQAIQEIMSHLEPDSAMVGYNISSGVFGEYETISFLSRHGCFSIPVPGVSNLSFFASLPRYVPTKITLLPSKDAVSRPLSSFMHADLTSNPSDQSDPVHDDAVKKTYIAIVLSDGDNLDLPYSRYDFFTQAHSTPLGWSISPFLNEFIPPLFKFYKRNLPPTDSFVCAPSGAGFCYPSKNANLPAFVDHTKNFMKQCGLEYLWMLDHPLWGYSPALLEMFAPFTKGMFLEYVIVRSYRQSMELHGGTPTIFSSMFIERDGNIASRIRKKAPKLTPGFLFVGAEMRYNSPEHIDVEVEKLDPGRFEVVPIPRFFDLLGEHLR